MKRRRPSTIVQHRERIFRPGQQWLFFSLMPPVHVWSYLNVIMMHNINLNAIYLPMSISITSKATSRCIYSWSQGKYSYLQKKSACIQDTNFLLMTIRI